MLLSCFECYFIVGWCWYGWTFISRPGRRCQCRAYFYFSVFSSIEFISLFSPGVYLWSSDVYIYVVDISRAAFYRLSILFFLHLYVLFLLNCEPLSQKLTVGKNCAEHSKFSVECFEKYNSSSNLTLAFGLFFSNIIKYQVLWVYNTMRYYWCKFSVLATNQFRTIICCSNSFELWSFLRTIAMSMILNFFDKTTFLQLSRQECMRERCSNKMVLTV